MAATPAICHITRRCTSQRCSATADGCAHTRPAQPVLPAACEPSPLAVTGPGATLPATTDGVSYCISPAAPPLTDTQRSRASKTLNRSLQQHKQVKLSLTPAYELLLLQPMSTYQQLTLGVGAFAGRVAAASQTRQMDQKLHEQDVQTEEVMGYDRSHDKITTSLPICVYLVELLPLNALCALFSSSMFGAVC